MKLQESLGAHDFNSYLKGVLEAGTTSNGIFGCKPPWNGLTSLVGEARKQDKYLNQKPAMILSDLFPNLRYIYMTRRDKVRQAISLELAEQTSLWNLVVREPFPKRKEARFGYFPIYEKRRYLENHEIAWQRYFSENNINPLRIYYEDLVSSFEETIGRMFDYLGVSLPQEFVFPKKALRQLSGSTNELWVRKYRRVPEFVIGILWKCRQLQRKRR